ncbi:MAG: FAD-dependent oxidoreductase [Desulfobacterales bacterium]|jgi:heterodisulfide reductase subunit A2|nr:FAD-dependent oxidoreductase [Desulfobacterales bacterium]MBT7697816.1 FAD-dependent oxidoreductase [Desulfobacterales bacterium]
MVTFKLNGKKVQGEEGEYIIQVADRYGVKIPTLCHHKVLEPAGMCRLCTVELFDGRRSRFVTACNYPIWEGMEIHTESELVIEGRKLLVELLLSRCPDVPIIKELATEYIIEKTRFKEENDDCILCGLCTRICEKMGSGAICLTGRGVEMEVDTPFQIQSDVCMACGACASFCPTGHITLEVINNRITNKNARLIPSEYDVGLQNRNPIYIPYAQAVPNAPVIDRETCIHFKTGECKVCTEYCGVNAIDHTQEDEIIEIDVGSIILAPGFQPFDPSKLDNYGYANFDNVMTSMEFERILSASGPTMGHITRISDNKEPKRIAWFQCVGSRDINNCDNSYCSSVCCMYAIKESVIAKEHAGDDLECSIFYMDMRTHGKDFERYYNSAKNEHGVKFIKSRVHTVIELPDSKDLEIRYADENGDIKTDIYDMIVLSVGLETRKETVELAKKLDIDVSKSNFATTSSFTPVSTSRDGIYVCGAFQGPKDIPQSVIDASAAASAAGELLSTSRNKLTKEKEKVPSLNVIGDRPRIGVFVCNCGINIGGVIDVPAVRDYAATLPYVEFVTDNMYSCAQDSQSAIVQLIQSKNLNRIVVAACSPKTHEPLFQETLTDAGLNKYLFEMVNIRNHNSWVHKDNPETATDKAKDLVRMSISKVALMKPLEEAELNVNQAAMVLGGGISGMTTALSLANQGYNTHLLERNEELGGQALNLFKTVKGEDIQANVSDLINEVKKKENIHIHLNTTLENVEGFVGNFKSTFVTDGQENCIEHGVAVMATGAYESQPVEYSYGNDPRILTSLELDKKLVDNDSSLSDLNSAVFIQCVGSRNDERPYCSRVCCTHSIENAIELKHRKPDMNVYILYRDIRTYGERELAYAEARKEGVIFISYKVDNKPVVEIKDGKLTVTVLDHVIGQSMELETDLITLASAIVPYRDEKLAQFFKIPMNDDGFFVERHAKLGPSEFATDGVFLCGLTHYPKPIDESIAHAKAAASRAVTLLARETINTSGTIAETEPGICSSCGVCVEICPYSAPSFIEADARMFPGKTQINPVLCKGCGLCVASCRSGAIHLNGFDNDEIFAQIFAVNE